MVTRREFCILGSVSVSAAALNGCAGRVTTTSPAILDTHTHFYDPQRAEGVPWPPPNDPLLYRPVLPSEYEALARPLGITRTLVVEASSRESDNGWVLNEATRHPFLCGLVGHLKPGRPGFEGALRESLRDRRFRGIRLGTWDGPPRVSDPDFLRDCRQLAEHRLTADVLVGPTQLELVAQLASAIPDLSLVVNHCANVRIDGRSPDAAWRRGIATVSRYRNVSMKVSGLVEGTGRADGTAPRDAAFYAPTLQVLGDAFGSQRLIFGSNWPVSARFGSLSTVVGIVQDYYSAQGGAVAHGYFTANAERIYRLGKT